MNDEKKNIREEVEEENNDLNKRINRLYGITTEEEEKPEVVYNPEEVQSIRKKLMILLIIICVFGIFFIYILINPLHLGSKKVVNNDTSQEENNTEEDNSQEEIPIGEVDISNDLVVKLNSILSFSLIDFYNIDTFGLYNNDVSSINDLPNDLKIYFVGKDDSFKELMDEIDLDNYIASGCNSAKIKLNKDKWEKVVTTSLGPNVVLADGSYKLLYFTKNYEYKNLTIDKASDSYTLSCSDINSNSQDLTKYLQQKLEKAEKTETGIDIYQRVVFIRKDGVYKDPNFKELITNDINTTYNDYINSGTLYKYTFTALEEGNYYLTNIAKVKEDV